jgi:iron complex outermembrane receptor protein
MRILPAFVLCILFSERAFPQSLEVAGTDSIDRMVPYVAEEVVVTATRADRSIHRLPYAIDLLKREDIRDVATGSSLEEALRSVPGVIVNDRNNLSQGDRISIRGLGSRASFGVRGIKIMLDDVPLTMPDGQSQLNNLDINAIGQIEVLRGPSSSLYGNASGGVLNIQSYFPRQGVPLGARMTYGQYGARKFEGELGFGSVDHSLFLKASDFRSDGFREHAYAKTTQLTGLHRSRLNRYWEIKSVVHAVDAPYLFNPSSVDKATSEEAPESVRAFVKAQGAAKKVEQLQGGVTLSHRRERTEFKTTAYGITRTLLNPIPGNIVELERKAGGLRSVFTMKSGWVTRWTTGIDLEVQDDVRREFENNGIPAAMIGTLKDEAVFNYVQYGALYLHQDEKVAGLGIFSEMEVRPLGVLSLTFGARLDHFDFAVEDHLSVNTSASGSRTMQQVSPMLGLTYPLGGFATLYSNLATGFQTPTTNELSNLPDRVGGFNPDLRPERIRNVEVGVRGVIPDHNLLFAAALYRLNISDMLIPFQVDNTEGDEIYYRNAGKTLNAGAEISLQWLPLEDLSSRVSYTFTDFVFDDYVVPLNSGASQLAGNQVPGVPRHHLYVDVAYVHASGFHSGIDLQFWSDAFSNDFNGPPPDGQNGIEHPPQSEFINDGYLRTDVRIGWKHSVSSYQGDLSLGINNVFNSAYNGAITPNAFGNRFYEPAPGRNWFLGMSISARL